MTAPVAILAKPDDQAEAHKIVDMLRANPNRIGHRSRC
jgi:hypothetical protein